MGVALSFVGLCFGAQAGTPEDVYWRARIEAIARLTALAKEKAAPDVIGKVEAVALEALRRQLFEIVGPLKVEGFVDRPQSHVNQLSEGPDFGQLDGVSFLAEGKGQGGALIVTTKPLLRLWLKEDLGGANWTKTVVGALKSDEFYRAALDPENGFFGVVDIALETPHGATFATAKLGRSEDIATDSFAPPQLVVTVVRGRWVLIVDQGRSTQTLETAECAAMANAAGSQTWGGSAIEETRAAWVKCERRNLPGKAAFLMLKREAQAIAERLARAK